jgi:DNA-binding CsgD family transcriptional regulator
MIEARGQRGRAVLPGVSTGGAEASESVSAGALGERAAVLATVVEAMRSGRGLVVSGPPASGVSSFLRSLVNQAVAADLTVGSLADLDRAAAAVPTPRVVVIDDAHLLSAETAATLAARVMTGDLTLVLGATRPSGLIGRLRSSGDLATVELGPLPTADILTVVDTLIGAVPDGATTRALADDSACLLGMLVPTVLAASASGALSITAGIARLRGSLPLAAAVVDRVAARRATLSPEADHVVEAVCVGREVPTAPMTETFGLNALAEAEQAGLISVDESGPVVRPAMGAVARVVRAELGVFGAARVARQLVATMPHAPPGQAVHWRLLAGDDPDPTELLAVATAAQQRGDLAMALDLADRAWRGDELAAGLVLAELTSTVGDRVGAATVIDDLLTRDDLPGELRAAGSLELATLHLWNFGQPERAIELATDVAAMTKGSDFEAVGQGALGAMLGYTGRCREAHGVVAPYLDREGPGQMLSCHVATAALAVQGVGDRAVELGRRGLALSEAGGGDAADLDPEILVVSLTLALELAGRLDEADSLTLEWYERATKRSVHHAWIALARMRLELLRGDLPKAARFAGEATAIFGDLDNHAPRRWAVAGRLLAAAQMGHAELVTSSRSELDELGESGVTFLDTDVARARAWADASSGRLDEGRAALRAAAVRAEEAAQWCLAAGAWHDLVRLGETSDVSPHLDAIAARVGGRLYETHARHARAFAADDPRQLADAAGEYAAMHIVLLAAEAAAHAASAADRRKDKAMRRAATTLLRELEPRCPEAATPPLLDVPMAVLSPRERDVARLAATGLTSRQIGERLHLSVRTVDNLLQRSYVKLGVAGRRELPGVIKALAD